MPLLYPQAREQINAPLLRGQGTPSGLATLIGCSAHSSDVAALAGVDLDRIGLPESQLAMHFS